MRWEFLSKSWQSVNKFLQNLLHFKEKTGFTIVSSTRQFIQLSQHYRIPKLQHSFWAGTELSHRDCLVFVFLFTCSRMSHGFSVSSKQSCRENSWASWTVSIYKPKYIQLKVFLLELKIALGPIFNFKNWHFCLLWLPISPLAWGTHSNSVLSIWGVGEWNT